MAKLKISIFLYNIAPSGSSAYGGNKRIGKGNYQTKVLEGKTINENNGTLQTVAEETNFNDYSKQSNENYDNVEYIEISQYYLEILQPVYTVREAIYDFMGLKLVFFNSIDEKIIIELQKRDEYLSSHGLLSSSREKDKFYDSIRLQYKWNLKNPNIITIDNFSLENKEHKKSLEFLISQVNAEIASKRIPPSAFSETDSDKLKFLEKVQIDAKNVLEKVFNSTPLQFGLSFLQQTNDIPFILRVSEKISLDGSAKPLFYFCTPLLYMESGMLNYDKIVEITPYIYPANIRVTNDNVLIVELILPIPKIDIYEELFSSISEFYFIAEKAKEFFKQAIDNILELDNQMIDSFFRANYFPGLDMKHINTQWSYLRGREIISKIKKKSFYHDVIDAILHIEPSEARDLLLIDQIEINSNKNMLYETLDLVKEITAPGIKFSSLRTIIDNIDIRKDEEALGEILKFGILWLDSIENYQENMLSPLRDLLFVLSDRLGLEKMLEFYPENTTPQIRLVWLSTAIRSSPTGVRKNEKYWLGHYNNLAIELDSSPYLFISLLEELIELINAFSLVPEWTIHLKDLKHKISKIAELSDYKEYYFSRIGIPSFNKEDAKINKTKSNEMKK